MKMLRSYPYIKVPRAEIEIKGCFEQGISCFWILYILFGYCTSCVGCYIFCFGFCIFCFGFCISCFRFCLSCFRFVYPVLDSVYPVLDTIYPVLDSVYPVLDYVYPVLDTMYPVLDFVNPVLCLKFPTLKKNSNILQVYKYSTKESIDMDQVSGTKVACLWGQKTLQM